MKQAWITKTGAPEVIELRDAPDPTPGRGEVRIRVHASGVNFADIMARLGLYPDAPPLPTVVGYEVSGVVDAVGVAHVAVADALAYRVAVAAAGQVSDRFAVAQDRFAPDEGWASFR